MPTTDGVHNQPEASSSRHRNLVGPIRPTHQGPAPCARPPWPRDAQAAMTSRVHTSSEGRVQLRGILPTAPNNKNHEREDPMSTSTFVAADSFSPAMQGIHIPAMRGRAGRPDDVPTPRHQQRPHAQLRSRGGGRHHRWARAANAGQAPRGGHRHIHHRERQRLHPRSDDVRRGQHRRGALHPGGPGLQPGNSHPAHGCPAPLPRWAAPQEGAARCGPRGQECPVRLQRSRPVRRGRLRQEAERSAT